MLEILEQGGLPDLVLGRRGQEADLNLVRAWRLQVLRLRVY